MDVPFIFVGVRQQNGCFNTHTFIQFSTYGSVLADPSNQRIRANFFLNRIHSLACLPSQALAISPSFTAQGGLVPPLAFGS